MPFMEWSEEMSVGVPSVDAQHKVLVGMVNELFDALKTGRGRDILGKILDGLINYTETHFAYEEALFAQTGYPDAETHTRQHEALTRTVLEVQEKYKSSPGFSLSLEVMDFLKHWLVDHILDSDKKFGPYLVAHGIK